MEKSTKKQKNAPTISVVEMYRKLHKEGCLIPVIKPIPSHPVITSPLLHRAGLALTGYTTKYPKRQIQLIGNEEWSYLESLSIREKEKAWGYILLKGVPAVIFSSGLQPDETCISLARQKGIALFSSHLSANCLQARAERFLIKFFAPCTWIHGTLVEVHGVGILLTGPSGIGKSECALSLIEKGHRLIADDMVYIVREDNNLRGYSNKIASHHIEIRGIGIIDVRTLFGVRAILPSKRIDVQIELSQWSKKIEYERIGLTESTVKILDIDVPSITIPVTAGKNLVTITEVIALNRLLKQEGINSAQEFNRNLILTLKQRPHTVADFINRCSDDFKE